MTARTGLRVFHGEVEILGPDMRFDLLLANLDTKGLRALFDTLPTRLAPGGRSICAGILMEEEGPVTATVRVSQLRVVARRAEGEWLCLTRTAEGS
ncbi:MAG: 50S ribosomal protein L11 methyltransferase [Candidatus Methylomirabilales bacterium]